jgi:hypothetical protein
VIEKPIHVETSRPIADGKLGTNGIHVPRRTGRTRARHPLILVVVGAFLVFAVLAVISGYIQKGLWMRQLGYSGIFWTLLSVKWGLCCVAFVGALLYLWINLRLAAKNSAGFRAVVLPNGPPDGANIAIRIPPVLLKLGMGAAAAVAALVFALMFYGQWDTYLRFRYGGSFGLSDPLFGADAGFYVFRLPFYELLQSSVSGLALIALLAVSAYYVYFGLIGFSRRSTVQGWNAKAVPQIPGIPSAEVLVVLLSRIERLQFHHLGHDRRTEYPRPIQLSDIRFGNSLLFRIGIEDGRPVLRAYVMPLPVEFSRIVRHAEEHLQQLSVRDLPRVVRHLHRFRVSGLPGADNFVVS